LRKKLLLLDLVLAALAAVLAVQVQDRLLEARKREAVVLSRRVPPVPSPPFSPLPVVQPLVAAPYAEIVEKDLFSVDRNPTVIVEVAAPKPMPDLPVFYGLLNLGDGPKMAIMSVKANQAPREVRFGGKVGEFTLVDATREDLILEWDGKTISKKISELTSKAPTSGSSAEAAQASAPDNKSAPAQARPAAVADAGPGADTGGGYHACVMGDSSPAGTVRDGLKKVIVRTPMGPACRWEPSK
jgi:hypothetical protein